MNWGRSVITVTLVAISSIVGALGTASVRAQNATPAADCPATTLEENKALVEGYWRGAATVIAGRPRSGRPSLHYISNLLAPRARRA